MKSIEELRAETDLIAVSWTQPKHMPLLTEIKYKCYLICELNEPYIATTLKVSSLASSLTITKLRPWSICSIKALALYNPARVDPGLNAKFQTLQSSKLRSWLVVYMHVSGLNVSLQITQVVIMNNASLY